MSRLHVLYRSYVCSCVQSGDAAHILAGVVGSVLLKLGGGSDYATDVDQAHSTWSRVYRETPRN